MKKKILFLNNNPKNINLFLKKFKLHYKDYFFIIGTKVYTKCIFI